MPTEADTCRTLITPKLQAAGWEHEPAATGLQQAKDYAEILDLKFAYATNGIDILEFDYITGLERRIPTFPSPADLWSRLRTAENLADDTAAQRLLTPANLTTGKEPRYYQRIAIDRVVQALLQGRRRVLLTMATGTGKTVVAFQICWKLWSSRWNRTCLPLAPTGGEGQGEGASGGHPPDGRGAGGEGIAPSPPVEERAGVRRPFASPSTINSQPSTPSGHPDYVCRVTSDEGDIGRGHMQRFQDVETRTPVILTTSQLLTTGLDAPTCRNIVLVRLVNSMVEFKQIIGRGTRVRDDYGKLWFNILDYTGTATRNFADPAFDGDPAFATQEEIDEHGQTKSIEVETPEEPEDTESAKGTIDDALLSSSTEEKAGVRNRKYYFDGGQVEIVAELVHELDADGKQLRVVKLTDYTAEKVRSLFARPEDLRACWVDAGQRADIIHQLAERGIDFQQAAAQAGQPDADPFDLLCHLAFNAPILTRRQRADRVKKKQAAMFNYLKPEAQEILNKLLEKYAADGELQFLLPDVLKLPPISEHGSIGEIVRVFGGPDELRTAVNQLQTLLYAE